MDTPEYHTFHVKHPFVEFTPQFDETAITANTLVIMDDMQTALIGPLRKRITDFCTRAVHHSMCSIVIVLHHLYASPLLRTVCLQADYLIYYHNPRDVSIVNRLAYEMVPQCPKFLQDVYNYVTAKSNRAYLFIDLSVHQNSRWRVRDNIEITEVTNFYVPVLK